MKEYTNEQLEQAVFAYVDALTLDDLVSIVADDLYEYYRKNGNTEEVLEFINEMQIDVIETIVEEVK